MKTTKHILFNIIATVFIFLSTVFTGNAQTRNAVTTTLAVTPFYTPYFSDYYETGSTKMLCSIILNDLNESSWDVKLRVTIASDAITITNPSGFTPLNSISLTPGVPVTVSGDGWTEYLDYSNLSVSGMDKNTLVSTGVLPEGLYTFKVEVLDYNSGVSLGTPAQFSCYISMGGIPQIISPKDEYLVPTDPQNIIFQWQLSQPALDPLNTEYQLILYEITSNDILPEAALANNNVLKVYEGEWSTTPLLVYDASAPSLETDKRYTYTIQVRDNKRENVFKNNGMSEAYWFSYGYPTGGNIVTQMPVDSSAFIKDQRKTFKWQSPDNMQQGQKVSYDFKMVKMQDDQEPEKAINENSAFYEESFENTMSTNGWEMVLGESIKADTWYAWQVSAITGTQEIAKSKVMMVKGAPLLESFKAADQTVQVLTLKNNDFNNLSGTCKIQLDKDGEKTVEAAFEGIKIVKSGDVYVLKDGEITVDERVLDPIEIKELEDQETTAEWVNTGIRLTSNRFEVKGYIKSATPFAVDGSDAGAFVSKEDYLTYNNFKLNGTLNFDPDKNKFQMLDPMGFSFEFSEKSYYLLSDNQYNMVYTGQVGLPESLLSKDGTRLYIPFYELKQLDYFTCNSVDDEVSYPSYHLLNNCNITVEPIEVVFDFSEEKSPIKISEKDWTGAFVRKYKMVYDGQLDAKGQLTMQNAYEKEITISSISNDVNWITSGGLNFYRSEDFSRIDDVLFNKFPANFDEFFIEIEDGEFKDGNTEGTIMIPVISNTKKFGFTMPISSDGFQTGYLDEKLDNQTFSFNSDGGENRADITIKRAVFADNERLDMTLDIEVPGINAKMTNIQGFRAYGDYYIGMEKRNGAVELEQQVEAEYDGYQMYLDSIGFVFKRGTYSFIYGGSIPLGTDVSGIDGPPRVNLLSVAKLGSAFNDVVEQEYFSTKYPATIDVSTVTINRINREKPKDLQVKEIYIELGNSIANLSGSLAFEKNNLDYGTVLKGQLKGFVYAPTKIEVASNILYGTKDKTDFWYFDAYFLDESGTGVNMGVVNLVALEARFYSHMEPTGNSESGTSSPEVVVNPKVKFGMAAYCQFIDASTAGKNVLMDLGLEIKSTTGDYKMAFSGEASFMNSAGRSATSITSAAKNISEALDVDPVASLIEEINNYKLDVGAFSVSPVIATDLTEAGLSLKTGNQELKAYGDFENLSAAASYSNGNISGSVEGNTTGGVVKFSDDKFSMSTGYISGSGEVAFNYGDYNLEGSFSKKTKNASFGFKTPVFGLDISADRQKKEGSLNLEIGSNTRMYVDAAKDQAGMGFYYDDTKIDLEASKTGSAEMNVNFGDQGVGVGFDKTTKEGYFQMAFDDFVYKLNASKTAGQILFENNNFGFDIGFNKTDKAGWLKLAEGDRDYEISIDQVNKSGKILFDNGDQSFGIGASKKQGSGFFDYENGSQKIHIEADKSAKSGQFDLELKGLKMDAGLNTDSTFMEFNVGNVDYSAAKITNGLGHISMKNGDDLIDLGGNKDGEGYMKLGYGNTYFGLGANKTTGDGYANITLGDDYFKLNLDNTNTKGSISTKLDGDVFNASYEDGIGSVLLKNSTNTISLAGGNGTGKFLYKYKKNLYNINFDNNDKVGGLRLVQGNDSVNIALNGTEKTAHLYTAFDGNYVGAALLNDGSGQLVTDDGNNRLELIGSTNGKSGLLLKGKNDLFEINANPTEQTGDLHLKFDEFEIQGDLAGKKGAANLLTSFDGTKLGASVIENGGGSLLLQSGDLDFEVTQNAEDKGKLYFSNDDLLFNIEGDKSNGGHFTLGMGSDSIVTKLDLTNESSSVNAYFSGNSIGVSAGADGWGEVKAQQGNNLMRIAGDASGSGELELAQSGNYVFLGSDKNETSASLTLVQNEDSIITSVNVDEGSGFFKIVDGSNSFSLNKTSEQQGLNFLLDGSSFALEQTNQGSGTLNIKNSDFNLGIDHENNKNAFALEIGQYKLETSQENSTVSAKVQYDNYELSLEKSDDNLYTLEASGNDKSLILQQLENYSYKTAYNDADNNLELDVNSDSNSGSLKGDIQGFSFDAQKSTEKNTLTLSIDDVDADIQYGDINKSFSLSKDQSAISYVIEGDNKTLQLQYENYKVQVDNNNNTVVDIDDKHIEVKGRSASSDPLTIVYNGETYEIPLDADGIAEKVISTTFIAEKGTTTIALNDENSIVINLSDKSIDVNTNFADKTISFKAGIDGADVQYGDYQFKVNNTDGIYIADNNRVNLQLNNEGLNAVLDENEVYYGGIADWKLKVPDKEASLIDGKLYLKNTDQYISLDKTNNEYKIFLQENLQLGLSNDSSYLALANQKISASSQGVYYSGNDMQASVSSNAVSYKDANNSLLVNDDIAQLVLGDDIKLGYKENEVEAVYKNYKAKVTPGKSYYFTDGDNTFDSDKELALSIDDYKVNINKSGYATLSKGKNSIQGSKQGINAKWDDCKLAFGADTTLFFAYKDVVVDLTQKNLSLANKDNSVSYDTENKAIEVSAGSGKLLKASPEGMELVWDDINTSFGTDKNLKFTDGKHSFEVTKGEQLDLEIEGNQIAYNLNDKTLSYANGSSKSVSVSLEDFNLKWDDVEANINADKNISYKDASRTFTISPDELSLEVDDKKISYNSSKEIRFENGDDVFAVSPAGLEIKYKKYAIDIDKTEGMRFSDGERTLVSEDEKLAFQIGDVRELAYYLKDEKITYVHDNSHSVSASADSFSMQIDDSEFNLSGTDGISYKDPDRNFEFGDNLVVQEQDTKLSIENLNSEDKKYSIAIGDYEMAYDAEDGFFLSNGSNSFAVGGKDAAFAVETAGKQFVYNEDTGIHLTEGDVDVTLGGDTYYAAFEYAGYGIAAKKDMSFLYYDKDNKFEITDEMGLRMNIEDYYLTVNSADTTFYYKDPKNKAFFEVDENNSDKAKVDVTLYDFILSVDNEGSAPVMNVGYDNTSVTIDAGTNWYATVQSGSDAHTVYKSDLYGVGYVNDVYSNEVLAAEMPESEVEMDGPSYIGKITDDGDGIIKAIVEGSYSSKSGEFFLHGAANANNYVCFDNVDFEASFGTDDWYVQVGKPDGKWMSVKPLCMGMTVKGYFYLDSKKMEMGFGHSFEVEAGASFGFGSIEAGFGYYYEAGLGIVFSPSFEIEGYVEAGANAWVKVCSSFWGCTKLVDIGMKGRLTAKIGNSVRLSGSVSGHVSVAHVVNKSVDVGVNMKL